MLLEESYVKALNKPNSSSSLLLYRTPITQGKGFGKYSIPADVNIFPVLPPWGQLIDNLHMLRTGKIDLFPVLERHLMIIQINFWMSLWYLSEKKANSGFAIFNCFAGRQSQWRNSF